MEHLREEIGRYTRAHEPLHLFFDLDVEGAMPAPVSWDRWLVDQLEEEELAAFPHTTHLAWVLCNLDQEPIVARDCRIEVDTTDALALDGLPGEGHNHTLRGPRVPLKDTLKEFSFCLAPTTRVATFDALKCGVQAEVELRRAHLRDRFNRLFFIDLAERARDFCAFPDEHEHEGSHANHFRKPTLPELYEKLYPPFEVDWEDAGARVQILQHSLFTLQKKAAL
jgi:hypothetical protein